MPEGNNSGSSAAAGEPGFRSTATLGCEVFGVLNKGAQPRVAVLPGRVIFSRHSQRIVPASCG